jgi:uncharacterized repeat protein (TIGR01451 family)
MGGRRTSTAALGPRLGALVVAWALLAPPAPAQPSPELTPCEGARPAGPDGPPVPPLRATFPPGREPVDPPEPRVGIRVRVPAESAPGEELTYRIVVENPSRAPAHHVAVKNPLPAHARFVRADPEPTSMSPQLLWQLGTLAPGARKEIKLVVVPTGDGEVRSCARVQFEHGQCVVTRVNRPGLRLRKAGPREVPVYDPITFRLEVSNTGRARARGVKLTDTLPEGLEFLNSKPATRGENPLTWDLGDLAPGQTRAVEYTAVAKKTGRYTNSASAEAAGGLRQKASATVRVGEARLAVLKSGPATRLVGRPSAYVITVRNAGTMSAANVRVTDELPADIAFVRASGGGRLSTARPGEGGAAEVRWSLGTLAPGAKRTLELVVRARRAGTFRNVANVAADRGLAEQGRAETKFEDPAGMAVEVDKGDDPVEVGRETTYTVRLLNTGKAAETKVGLAVTVPEGMKVVGEKGPTAGREEGRKVTFEPLDRLAPGAEPTYTVRVRGERAGGGKLLVEATPDRAGASPVKVEEAVTVEEAKEAVGGERQEGPSG